MDEVHVGIVHTAIMIQNLLRKTIYNVECIRLQNLVSGVGDCLQPYDSSICRLNVVTSAIIVSPCWLIFTISRFAFGL